MQNTPFNNVQHHQDGKHIFTVQVDDEKKMFVTTSMIDTAKALRNALVWRNSKTGQMLLPSDEVRIERFVRELETPTESPKPVKVVTVRPTIPSHVKVKELPSGVRRVSESTMRKTVKAGRPKVTETDLKQHIRARCKAALNTANRKRPSLPAGVSLYKLADGALCFSVDFYDDKGKAASRPFRVGKPDVFSLARYRLMRHVAICFRKEFLMSVIEKRPMDWEAFDNFRRKIKDGVFRWPFTGTLPEGFLRSIRKPATKRIRRVKRTGKRGLPVGVSLSKIVQAGKSDQVMYKVSYTQPGGKTTIKGFYVGLANHVGLAHFRIARHAALKFRQQYELSRSTNTVFDAEPFINWRQKIENGTFQWPYSGSIPESSRKVRDNLISDNPRKIDAEGLARAIFINLTTQPEFAPILSLLDTERAEDIFQSMIRCISNTVKI